MSVPLNLRSEEVRDFLIAYEEADKIVKGFENGVKGALDLGNGFFVKYREGQFYISKSERGKGVPISRWEAMYNIAQAFYAQKLREKGQF